WAGTWTSRRIAGSSSTAPAASKAFPNASDAAASNAISEGGDWSWVLPPRSVTLTSIAGHAKPTAPCAAPRTPRSTAATAAGGAAGGGGDGAGAGGVDDRDLAGARRGRDLEVHRGGVHAARDLTLERRGGAAVAGDRLPIGDAGLADVGLDAEIAHEPVREDL